MPLSRSSLYRQTPPFHARFDHGGNHIPVYRRVGSDVRPGIDYSNGLYVTGVHFCEGTQKNSFGRVICVLAVVPGIEQVDASCGAVSSGTQDEDLRTYLSLDAARNRPLSSTFSRQIIPVLCPTKLRTKVKSMSFVSSLFCTRHIRIVLSAFEAGHKVSKTTPRALTRETCSYLSKNTRHLRLQPTKRIPC